MNQGWLSLRGHGYVFNVKGLKEGLDEIPNQQNESEN
jgi:hypothetical protein